MFSINSLYNLAMAKEQEPAYLPPSYSIRAGFRFNQPHQLLNTIPGPTYCAEELFRTHGVQRPDFINVSGRDKFITMCRWTGPEAGIAVSKVDDRGRPLRSWAPSPECRAGADSSQGVTGRAGAPRTVLPVRASSQD